MRSSIVPLHTYRMMVTLRSLAESMAPILRLSLNRGILLAALGASRRASGHLPQLPK